MSVTITTGEPAEQLEKRPLGQAMWRGALGKCPSCGEGKLFKRYLKVEDTCSVCGEDLHHHRADDLPAYLAIFIVGHVLVGAMLHMSMVWHVEPMVYLYTLVPLTIALPLVMLPWLKGATVGLQWALRMHGFGEPYDPQSGI